MSEELESKITTEEIHKEIDLIQSCISRMAQNSFMVKGWYISIIVVILALLTEKINFAMISITLAVVTILFWYLDSFFLTTEKKYREIYSWALQERPKNNKEFLYELNPHLFKDKIKKTDNILRTMFTLTLFPFYGIPLTIIATINIYSYIC